ncbi:MAG: alpha-1,4-glucan--maltose-1-phosphate maltosyltransferase [Alphaproteobacteria bacterium]|nr:alpha-1,4-glucan--maltose-1-phosphate maltosyltransferase [Alphaproteobacteria bacterium]
MALPSRGTVPRVQKVSRLETPIETPLARALYPSKRIAIFDLAPSVDNGSFRAKRTEGDRLSIEADLVCDGHGVLAAAALLRHEGTPAWRRIAMGPVGNDRYTGEAFLAKTGLYEFQVEAWLDVYAGFVRDLEKKRLARQFLDKDAEEGRGLIEAARQLTNGKRRQIFDAILTGLDKLPIAEWPELLAAKETVTAMASADQKPFLARSETRLVEAERKRASFGSWYELFPRSETESAERHGTFRDVIARLPRIAAMGFDVLYLPPIHPIGITNRKGRNNALMAAPGDPGSPYAIGAAEGGHDAIHPQLGTIDDFRALVAATRREGMEIALDFAVQCSPDHPWLKEHPDWFDRRPDGSIKFAENPPKKYEDIVNVDFYAQGTGRAALWTALRNIVLYWIGEGVKIFRVDNPHTKPLAFWQWLIADIRGRYPEVIFLSEAFTRPKVMQRLAKIGFNQSYTYFTWRNTKAELTEYMTELTTPPVSDFFRPNFFVNTPDINPVYLQSGTRAAFLVRAALAATLSGSWGLYSGFELCESEALPGREEYRDSEKYEIKPRDWNKPGNITGEIAALNALRKREPALQSHMGLTFYNAFNDNILYFAKHAPGRSDRILVMVNLDPHTAQECDYEIPLWEWGLADNQSLEVEDLLYGYRFVWTGKLQHIRLETEAPYHIWRVQPRSGRRR